MEDFTKTKILFMGTSTFAAYILQTLRNNNYNISAVFTQPDKRSGRNQELKKSAVKIVAEELNIPIFTPGNLNEEAIEQVRSVKPDLIIVAAYGKILPPTILSLSKLGNLNLHASLLPQFRGPSPIQNVLLRGEQETGITIILMDEKVDEGDIIAQEKLTIDKNDASPDLSQKLAQLGSSLLLKTLPLWIEGKITPVPQDPSQATYCQLIERADGKINWTDEAIDIHNRWRAFYPWPGIYTFWEKENENWRLKLNRISFLSINPETTHHLGEVFQISDKIGVQTSKGIIILEEIQMEGRKNIPVQEFIKGNPDFVGSILK